jgi:hypothetical protein
MKRAAILLALLVACFSMASPVAAQGPTQGQADNANGDRLVYANFENVQDKRPFSNRGGFIQLISYQESTPSRYKGLENASPPAPEAVRLKQDDPNRAIAFDYELYSPNQYAGVGVEVHGQPDKDGKTVADDVSGYKFLTMQIYVTGVSTLRVELISRGQGVNMTSGFPQMSFKTKPGFNTYKFPLNSLSQPPWAQTKVSTKDVLKKLTAVALTAYCEQCTPVHGTIVVDDIIFQK